MNQVSDSTVAHSKHMQCS